MARRKTAQQCKFLPWLSARKDCTEGRFIQIGNSLFLSPEFQNLSAGAQILYLEMSLEAGGKREFSFPRTAIAKYGIPLRSARRYVNELEEHGFLDIHSGFFCKAPNEYVFSQRWKEEKEAAK